MNFPVTMGNTSFLSGCSLDHAPKTPGVRKLYDRIRQQVYDIHDRPGEFPDEWVEQAAPILARYRIEDAKRAFRSVVG